MSRIAYLVSDYYAPSHTFVRREVAALRASSIDVDVFSVQGGGAAEMSAESLLGRSPLAYIAALGWAMITRPLAFLASWWLAVRHRGPGIKALVWSQFHFVEAMMLARLLHRSGAERLHNHFANSGATVGLIASRLTGLPWSLTLHGISETEYPAGLLLGKKLETASFVACASYFMRAQAMRTVDSSHWPKMAIVRCGIDMTALPAPTPFSDAGPARIVCVGRLSPEKGYAGLLDALAAIAESDGEFRLVIVGDGPQMEAVQTRATELGLVDRIRFAGALPETETLGEIARADVLVLPSLMEGLPVVLMEAMAMGRPVLASRVAGIPELVVETRSGFLFTPSDWDDLARRLSALLSCRADWEDMGRIGRAKIEEEFKVELSASRMARLFSGEVMP